MLQGDSYAFDNALYLVGETQQTQTVLYLGSDRPDDANGLLYYLERAFPETPHRIVKVEARSPTDSIEFKAPYEMPLVVLDAHPGPEALRRIRQFAIEGGTVLKVVSSADPADEQSLAILADIDAPKIEEAKVSSDVLLGEIAFDHPLFAPLAGAQFNDFTKIHFWKYRRIDPPDPGSSRVLARFETGDPALVENPVGTGRLVVLLSSWSPADSQLARSSKFVPLMAGLLNPRGMAQFEATSLKVGDSLDLPSEEQELGRGRRMVQKPDGTVVDLGPEDVRFRDTDQPGLYALVSPSGRRWFAVNLDPQESKTATLQAETLEQLGCRLVNPTRPRFDPERMRQLRNAELEGRQKFWRWLILTAIVLLIAETWLSGRLVQPHGALVETSAS
jgi:hypothetical protein